jgi:hypothetical protein
MSVAFSWRLWQRATSLPDAFAPQKREPPPAGDSSPRLAAFLFGYATTNFPSDFGVTLPLFAAWAAPAELSFLAGSPEAASPTAKSRPGCNGSRRPAAGLL